MVNMGDPGPVTRLLNDWADGNPAALDELAPQVHRELHALARAYLARGRPNQTLQPTALINEVYVRLIDQSQPVRCKNRSHFFGLAARLMRMILVDYARAHRSAKRGGGEVPVALEETIALAPDHPPHILEVHEALSRLTELDARKGQVIELRYFGGMSREEIAAALGIGDATVKRDLRLGEAWLRRHLTEQSRA
jgi:RNA polymerase sigma factor (TIGR02999 family)